MDLRDLGSQEAGVAGIAPWMKGRGGGGTDCGSGAVVGAHLCDEERRERIARQDMAHDCGRLH